MKVYYFTGIITATCDDASVKYVWYDHETAWSLQIKWGDL